MFRPEANTETDEGVRGSRAVHSGANTRVKLNIPPNYVGDSAIENRSRLTIALFRTLYTKIQKGIKLLCREIVESDREQSCRKYSSLIVFIATNSYVRIQCQLESWCEVPICDESHIARYVVRTKVTRPPGWKNTSNSSHGQFMPAFDVADLVLDTKRDRRKALTLIRNISKGGRSNESVALDSGFPVAIDAEAQQSRKENRVLMAGLVMTKLFLKSSLNLESLRPDHTAAVCQTGPICIDQIILSCFLGFSRFFYLSFWRLSKYR